MTWNNISGHQAIISQFKTTYRNGRLGHAYLFVGTPGIGKRLFAHELAQALLCEKNKAPTLEACGICPSCLRMEAGTHPNLQLFRKPDDLTEFPIELVRELHEKITIKPAGGQRTIAIIDGVDTFNEASSNAFLKTLEEPPPGSLLLLIGGESSQRQLPTILSRCQVIRFSPLNLNDALKVLQSKGVNDLIKARKLLQMAEGSPGRALELDDEQIWAMRTMILKSLCARPLNPIEHSRDWLQYFDKATSESAMLRQRLSLVFRLVIVFLSHALKMQLGYTCDQIEAEEERMLREFSQRHSAIKVLAWLERALEADTLNHRKIMVPLLVESFLDFLARD